MSLKLAIIIVASLIILGLSIVLFAPKGAPLQKGILPIPLFTSSPSPTPTTSFKVVSTTPADGQLNVFPGEIQLLITTNQSISSDKDLRLEFSPLLPFYYKFSNSFPSQNLIVQIYGGLARNTTYQVRLRNNLGELVHTLSFTTSSEQPESSSSLVSDYEKQLAADYYPLSAFTPYETTNFKVGYTDRLELNVVIKNTNINQVKQEVDSWIRSKNVDPATHKLNYINRF